MFIHPSLYLLSLIFAIIIYWAIPRSLWITRAVFVTVLSIILISLKVPTLGLCLIGSSLLAFAYSWIRKRNGNIWFVVVFIIAQITLMVSPDLGDMTKLTQDFTFVGLTFFTLRNIGFLIDIYKQKCESSFLDIIFLNAFFPTYSAGPIENVKTVNSKSCDTIFDFDDFQMGIVRIFIGILKFYLISESIAGTFIHEHFPHTIASIEASSSISIVTFAILGWLNLYVAFSGYADIAIGSSKLFGIRIRENFNFPFLATNIQQFWQRWNISVMNYVSEYIYINFVRRTGLRIAGIYLVFFAMGMWHRVSANYVIWAVAHGTAMSLLVVLRRRTFYQNWQNTIESNKYLHVPIIFMSCLLTLSFVSIVSAVANSPDLNYGFAILKVIFL